MGVGSPGLYTDEMHHVDIHPVIHFQRTLAGGVDWFLGLAIASVTLMTGRWLIASFCALILPIKFFMFAVLKWRLLQRRETEASFVFIITKSFLSKLNWTSGLQVLVICTVNPGNLTIFFRLQWLKKCEFSKSDRYKLISEFKWIEWISVKFLSEVIVKFDWMVTNKPCHVNAKCPGYVLKSCHQHDLTVVAVSGRHGIVGVGGGLLYVHKSNDEWRNGINGKQWMKVDQLTIKYLQALVRVRVTVNFRIRITRCLWFLVLVFISSAAFLLHFLFLSFICDYLILSLINCSWCWMACNVLSCG